MFVFLSMLDIVYSIQKNFISELTLRNDIISSLDDSLDRPKLEVHSKKTRKAIQSKPVEQNQADLYYNHRVI